LACFLCSRLNDPVRSLLEAIVADDTQAVDHLAMLSEQERHRVLFEWNDTRKAYPFDKCVRELFEETAAKMPDGVAVVFEEEQLRYGELNHRANRLAHYLRELGVRPDDRVALCVERGYISFLPPYVSPSSTRPLLFCLPYAGGSPHVYRSWVSAAPVWLDVCPIELPGRGRLMKEPFALSLVALAQNIAEAISPLTARPYAIFGHSMGSLLAYEIAVKLNIMGHREPRRLVVSGARPLFLSRLFPPVGDLPNADLLEHLKELGGTPEAVLDNNDLMEFFLPILRSDFRLCETYQRSEPHRLQIPLTVLSGRQDHRTPEADMRLWQLVTTGAFALRQYAGGHFFISDPTVFGDVCDDLSSLRSEVVGPSAETNLERCNKVTSC
jgi:medium-chain acyl-[acyl-carrier-protein] hydrolase